MNDQLIGQIYLDSLAEELRADYPCDGEFTVRTFMQEMEKRGLRITREVALGRLEKLVERGEWSMRMGHSLPKGNPTKIFRPIANKVTQVK